MIPNTVMLVPDVERRGDHVKNDSGHHNKHAVYSP